MQLQSKAKFISQTLTIILIKAKKISQKKKLAKFNHLMDFKTYKLIIIIQVVKNMI
jgi:hypothetical protein